MGPVDGGHHRRARRQHPDDRQHLHSLKHFRRVATCYDKLAANFLAIVQLASVRLWLRAYESTAWRATGSLGRAAQKARDPRGWKRTGERGPKPRRLLNRRTTAYSTPSEPGNLRYAAAPDDADGRTPCHLVKTLLHARKFLVILRATAEWRRHNETSARSCGRRVRVPGSRSESWRTGLVSRKAFFRNSSAAWRPARSRISSRYATCSASTCRMSSAAPHVHHTLR